jgi:ABC-type transport system substrate-binding protein
MKHFACHWLAVSSLLWALVARAETRPQYGGTLRVMTHAAPTTLDPADARVPDSFARRGITSLLFDTLVTMDETGHARPGLAESWQASGGNLRWQLRLRHGVKFHDGTPLTGETVAVSLRLVNPTWSIRADGDSVIISWDVPLPDVPAELALSRNAILKRDSAEKVSGTGPFHIVEWQPGKKLTLAAEEDYWRGRPFLDGLEIELGRSFRDQSAALETNRVDVVEVAPEQAHHFSPAKGRLVSSAPAELMALVFARDVASPDDKLLREALGLSVERGSMQSVLLQGAGQPTGSLLPTSISGYGFVFPTQSNLPKARQLRDQVQQTRIWTIGYDANDPLARLLVERIALNAKDAGLSLVPTSVGSPDLRFMRIPLASSDPLVTLMWIAARTGFTSLKIEGGTVEEVFATEQAAMATLRVIPLFHLPAFYAANSSLKDWSLRSDGSLDLANAWLGAAK